MAVVLVADDDGHIREVVRFALEKAGHRIIEASDGADALRRLAEERVDVAVLDIIMPELDGIEVCRKLREKSSIPVLFLSSRDDELDRVLGLEIGADDYVTKPFSPRELAARVKALLRRATPAAEPSETPLRRGDLVVEVRLVLPQVLDERSKELLREFGRINREDVRSGLVKVGQEDVKARTGG